MGFEIDTIALYGALRSLRQRIEGRDLGRPGVTAHGLIEEFNHGIEFETPHVRQMFLANQGQQAFRLLDTVHGLLGGLRIGFAGLDRGGDAQLFQHLLEARILDPRLDLGDAPERTLRLLLNQLRGLGVIDLPLLPGIEIAPAMERRTDRRHGYFEPNVARIQYFEIADQISAGTDDTIIEIRAIDAQRA